MITRALVCLSLVFIGAFDTPYGKTSASKSSMLALASNGCSACRMHEEFRATSLEAIKEQILSKFGLKQAPNMTRRALPKIPSLSILMDKYGMQSDQPQPVEPGITHHEEIDEYAAKTEHVFALAQPHQRLRHSKGSLDVIYFKFSDKIIQHRVMRAELSLWIWGTGYEGVRNDDEGNSEDDENDKDEEGPESSSNTGPVTIILQRILRTTTESGGPSFGPVLKTKHPRPIGRRGGWITIDLKRMVAEWFRHPRDNLGVAIKIIEDHGAANGNVNNHRRNSWPVETNASAEYAPYLEIHTQELDARRGARIKRNVGLNCDDKSQERRCCRYKLTVDFEQFGWDWIIAPKKYEANYCSGDCPMAFLPVYPNTHIVSLAEPSNNTGPCCAPRKLSDITMLYFDNEFEIIFARLPGMVVERCGCS